MLLTVVAVLLWAGTACSPGTSDPTGTEPPITIEGGDGQEVEIQGGGEAVANLVAWGLDRFSEAGLAEPRVPVIQLDPDDPGCSGATGIYRESADGRSIVICLAESLICPAPDSVEEYRLPARSCILHELAHAWESDNVDDLTRDQFLAAAPVSIWLDPDAEWEDQGVEHAAEIIMWGLMDERLTLHRLESPPCSYLSTQFRLLTGVDPLVTCGEAP
jgi:hypothetical protein